MEEGYNFSILPDMGEQKHTPGPWKVRYMKGEDDPEAGFFVEAKHTHPDAAYGIDILCDGDAYYPWQQRLADAKLIASAPELLEQLKKLKEENETLTHNLELEMKANQEKEKSLTEQVSELKSKLRKYEGD